MGKQSKGVIFILLVIIVILSALVVLTGADILNFKESKNDNITVCEDNNNDKSLTTNDISQKSSISKSQILSYYKDKISDLSSDNQYSVVDINNDDIPELFIYVTGVIGNQIIADTSVYTYDENKGNEDNNYIVYVGSISGRIDNNTILYKMNDGSLLSVYGHMGYESIAYFKLQNDWLVRTDFSSKETNDYMLGDTEIQFMSCDDTSLIDNYN